MHYYKPFTPESAAQAFNSTARVGLIYRIQDPEQVNEAIPGHSWMKGRISAKDQFLLCVGQPKEGLYDVVLVNAGNRFIQAHMGSRFPLEADLGDFVLPLSEAQFQEIVTGYDQALIFKTDDEAGSAMLKQLSVKVHSYPAPAPA